MYVVGSCDGSMLLKRAKDPFGNKSIFLSGRLEAEGVRISYSNQFLDNDSDNDNNDTTDNDHNDNNNDNGLSMRDLCCWSM